LFSPIDFQYAAPGSRRHEDVLVHWLDRQYFLHRLSDFELEVWRKWQQSFNAKEIAIILETDEKLVNKALRTLGII